MFASYSNQKKQSNRSPHTSQTKSESSSPFTQYQLKAENPIGMFSTDQIVQLQKRIGNGAVAHLLDPSISVSSQVVLQRIIIDDEEYTLEGLYELLLFSLEEQGYKTWGVKSQIREFFRENKRTKFNSLKHIRRVFMFWIRKRSRKVKGREKSYLVKFNIAKMSRPAWPKGIKKKLGYMKKDNIRHVIRNATLKRALEIEYNRQPQQDRNERIREIAEHNGLPTDATIDKIAQSIYKKVYLNLANLFAGRGDYNQLIGFAADPVKEYGDELLRNGETPISPSDVVEKIKGIIQTASRKARLETLVADQFCLDVDELFAVFEEDTPSKDIGELVTNIGLNFGFDLIDGRVPKDRENLAERQGLLLQVETELQNFISSNGTIGSLKDIFKKFLEIER